MIVGLDVESKRMKCSHCSKVIKSKYYRYDRYSKVYCDSCFSKGRKCDVCSLPSLETFLIDDLKVCIDCYSQKYHCRSCSKDLKNGELRFIPGIQGFFCPTCIKSSQACSRCGFPSYSRDNLLVLENSILLCPTCQSTSVLSEDIANNIYINVAQILNYKMNLLPIKHLKVFLSTMREIKTGHSDILEEMYGTTGIEQKKNELYPSFCKKEGNHYEIFIVNGLPLNSFISVLTHEYALLWQMKYGSKRLGRILWEGFAEWVATKMMMLLGYHDEIKKIESSGEELGFGLKKIQVIEKSKGTKGVLEMITQAK